MTGFIGKVTVAVAGLATFAAAGALAQGPYVRPDLGNNAYRRPAISPYLNLSRGGNPAVNYYGLVRPQLDQATAIDVLRSNQNRLQRDVYGYSQEQAQQILTTGHASGYLNHLRYFQNQGRTGYTFGAGGAGGFPFAGGTQGGASPLGIQGAGFGAAPRPNYTPVIGLGQSSR